MFIGCNIYKIINLVHVCGRNEFFSLRGYRVRDLKAHTEKRCLKYRTFFYGLRNWLMRLLAQINTTVGCDATLRLKSIPDVVLNYRVLYCILGVIMRA